MAWNFLAVECAGYALFLSLGWLADYGKIYNELFFAHVLNYRMAYLAFLIVAQLVLTAFSVFHWYLGYYQISSDKILVAGGVLRRRKTVFLLERIDEVTWEYSIFGKVFHYGAILLHDRVADKTLRLPYVPTPQKYTSLIMKLKRQHRGAAALVEVPEISKLLGQTEHEQLEFKSTMRWDMQGNQVSRTLEKSIMKTVAAFMNSDGGHLVVGVDDKGTIVGLQHDLQSLNRPDADGFENHFTHVFNSVIGAPYRHLVRLHFPQAQDQQVCIVQVAASRAPVYARFDSGEQFFVRTGNSSTPLSLSEAAAYIRQRQRGVA